MEGRPGKGSRRADNPVFVLRGGSYYLEQAMPAAHEVDNLKREAIINKYIFHKITLQKKHFILR